MGYCPHCGTRLEEGLAWDGRRRPRCPQCGFVHYPDPKVAVAVLVAQNGRLLMGRRSHEPQKGAWSFPAGYVDAGEKVEDAARREVTEETGLEVSIDRLLGVYSEPGNPVILIAYAGTIVGGEMAPGPEAMEARFFPLQELPPLAFGHDHQVVQDWIASLTGQRPLVGDIG